VCACGLGVHTYVFVCVYHVCVHAYVYMYLCVSVHTYVCVYIIHVSIQIFMYYHIIPIQANHYGRHDISKRLVEMASKDSWHLVSDIDKFLYEHNVCYGHSTLGVLIGHLIW